MLPAMKDLALRLRGLTVRAPSGAVILDRIDWELVAGERGLIIGPSGSGKSRLLRAINRLDEPCGGVIEILGRPQADWPVGELRRRVGWVGQKPALTAGTGRRCLEVAGDVGRISESELAGAMEEALAIAGVAADVADRPAPQLSGGERHRLAIARALLLKPRILLLDEPSGALDGAGAAGLLRRLMEWQDQAGATLIVVTHRIEDTRLLGGQMLVLDRGRVRRSGKTTELLADPGGAGGYDVRELLTGAARATGRAEPRP
jgi:ABC-type methionine transport system ATPase subunit